MNPLVELWMEKEAGVMDTLRSGASRARDAMSDAFASGKQRAGDAYASGKQKASDAYASGKERATESYGSAKQKANEAYASGKKKAKRMETKVRSGDFDTRGRYTTPIKDVNTGKQLGHRWKADAKRQAGKDTAALAAIGAGIYGGAKGLKALKARQAAKALSKKRRRMAAGALGAGALGAAAYGASRD